MNGIVILDESADVIMKLPNEEAGALIKALISGEGTGLPQMADLVFPILMGQVNRMRALCDKNRENGKRGGRPKKNPDETQTKPKQNPDETQTKTPYQYHTNTIPNNKRFTPPTISEVEEYVAEKGLNVDAQRFVDFYSSKGWKVGTSPMKDWRAACRNWGRDDRKVAKIEKPVFNFSQRGTDYDSLLTGIGL